MSSVRFDTPLGMVPSSLLSARNAWVRLVSWPIDDGIVPVRLLTCKYLNELSAQNARKRVAASSQSREIGQRGQVGDGARQVAGIKLKGLKTRQGIQRGHGSRELRVADRVAVRRVRERKTAQRKPSQVT